MSHIFIPGFLHKEFPGIFSFLLRLLFVKRLPGSMPQWMHWASSI